MTGYWMSWVSPVRLGGFTLHSPWWITGADYAGNPMVVAAVQAGTESEAREKVLTSYDTYPQHFDRRFCEARPDGWNPLTDLTDRFPVSEWMKWELS